MKNITRLITFSIMLFSLFYYENANAQVPFFEDFEAFTNGRANQGGWNNVRAADPDWTADNAGTTSGSTGPDVDHTLGTTIGIYVYLETSSGALGNRDTLSSPSISVDTAQAFLELGYWYHMAGATMGEMQVWVESAGIWDSVTTYTGAQQIATSSPWLSASHILTGYGGQNVTIHFIGERGTSFTGDMAVDDISLTVAPANNIGISNILRPLSGCGLSSTDTVEVVITNFGAATQSNFNVGYSLNGVAITAETVTDSVGVGMSLNYTFTTVANLSAAGNYNIDAYTLLTGDSITNNDSSSTSVFNNPVVSSFPYSESFESGAADWRVTGGLSTFELGAPINTIIDTASDGTEAWVTDLDGPYVVNESGAVNSPCFDFTNVDNPTIEMDIWWDSENSWDGTVLQSSIDGGATWQKVGADGDPDNWFNDNSILGLVGIEPSQEGWTGSPGSLGWVTAKHALDGLGGLSSVQLRVAFGSDGSVVDEGFAFDNVNIYQVYTVPFAEDYEDFNNGRANQNDWDNRNSADPDWTADNGGTTSGSTGPDVDHTLGTSVGEYIYLETSSGSQGNRDTLSSPSIVVDISQTTLLFDYWYHMAGATMGEMQVWVESVGVWDSVTTYTGAQQTATSSPWLSASHILTGYAGQEVILHFIGEKGSSFTGDMAVDDVSLTVAPNDNIGVTAFLRPVSGCGLSSSDTVEVVITNFGAATQSNFNVGYSLNGVAITAETVTGSVGVGMSLNYTFTTVANLSAAGNYNIDAYTLLTGDSITNNDSSSTSVFNNPVVSSFPYSESFESGAADWRVTGGLSTFELGAPINTIIDTASDGTEAWVTDLDGPYVVNESGAVSSPCFDFTNVDNPTIEMDIWWDSENSWDGTVLQSSIDGGATWQKVGADGDPDNWFNDNSILGLAGIEPSQEGWTGSPGSLGWVTAKHALDGLGGLSSVQLRVAFGSDGSVVDEGFAFDNVNIYDNVPYYPIGTINTVDSIGVGDSIGLVMQTSGTVVGVDLDGNNGLNFYIIDMSSSSQEGINIFNFNDVSNYVVTEGDSIRVWGDVNQFNGQQQVFVDSIEIISTGAGAFVPAARGVNNLDESTEANHISLIDAFVLLDASGSFSYNMDATNGIDTITIRVDADTDINDSLNVTGQSLVVGDTICGLSGVGGQFDSSSPYDDGYQVFPMRFSDLTICRLTAVCNEPTALSSSNLSTDSATLTWTENGTAIQWEVSYGSTGFTAGAGTEVIANANPFDLLSLNSNTAYDWYVRAICGAGDTSIWSDTSSFTTLAMVLPYYAIGTINTVDSVGVVDSLNVDCRISGTVTGIDRRGGGYEFALIDLSSGFQEGVTVFAFNDYSYYLNPSEGDSLEVYGTVAQFNGLTQFNPDSIVILQTATGTVAMPIQVAVLDESTESKLLELSDDFVLLDPSGSGSYNMDATNGIDTITIRIDSQSDIDDSLNISSNALFAGDTICGMIGIGGQFDNSLPYDDGYQIFPSRYSDIVICRLAVGLNDVAPVQSTFSIVPNPSSGEFNIRTSGFNNPSVRIQIRDMSGRIVKDEILSNANVLVNKSIDLVGNAKGIYFISIFDGNQIINQKLILR